jgi:glycosyltransferase involved in cell wall biosynthesis
MRGKKFSFVIPAYNCKLLLRNTLEALNQQTGYGSKDYEVIVVDDGSEDQTGKYIEGVNRNYALKYLYLKRASNSARARARNYGWQAAEGEIVVFIDADIIVKPGHLSELDRFYRYAQDLVVVGNRIMLPEGTGINLNRLAELFAFYGRGSKFQDVPYFIFDALSYNAAAIRTPGFLLVTNNSAVPKRYLENVNGFDEKYRGWGCEDFDLGYRLQVETGVKFAVNSKLEVLHQYHVRPANALKELERNKRYLGYKFPYLSPHIPICKEYEMWHILDLPRNAYLEQFIPDRRLLKKVVLNYRPGDDLERFKETVSQTAGYKRLDLEVNDYAENTDLDIWIQLLGRQNSTPRYYPVSKQCR